MREIKCRALELDSPSGINWVYGCFVAINGYWMNNDIPDYDKPCVRHYIYSDDGIKYEVAESTVCQFTGIKDKNGADIYEDDILSQEKNCMYHNGRHNLEVSFLFDQFCSGLCSLVGAVNHFDAEVIGNIHQSPELLEQ